MLLSSTIEDLKTIRINMSTKTDTIMHIATVFAKGKKKMHCFRHWNE